MGNICQMLYDCKKPYPVIFEPNIDLEKTAYKEIADREIINGEKLIVKFKIIEYDEENQLKDDSPIDLEVIHVEEVDITMPASRQHIDEGNKLPFIYTTKIQNKGKEKEQENGQEVLEVIFILQVVFQLKWLKMKLIQMIYL